MREKLKKVLEWIAERRTRSIPASLLRQTLLIMGILVTSLTAYFTAASYLEGEDPRDFRMWQEWYAPAVALGCGYGYVMLPMNQGDPLHAFLSAKSSKLDCSQVKPPEQVGELGRYQSEYRYLIGLVGLTWKMTGPDWGVMRGFISVLVALAAVWAFLLCRAVIGAISALVVTLLFILAPEHIEMATRMRDYVKAPFVFAAIALALYSTNAVAVRHLIYAATAGAIVGIGFGFRPDVVLLLPFVLIVLIGLCAPQNGVKQRLLAGGVFLATFATASAPIFLTYVSEDSLMPHVTILGLSDLASYNLATQPGSYAWGINHADLYVLEAMNAYAAVEFQGVDSVPYTKSEYAAAGMTYLLEMLRLFPGDMFLRVGAAVVSLVEASIVEGLRLESFRAIYGGLLFVLTVASISGVVATCFSNRRRGVAFGLAYLFMAASVALQFEHRHYFHAEFFAAVGVAALIWNLTRRRTFRAPWRIAGVFAGTTVVIFAFMVVHSILLFAQSHWLSLRLAMFLNSDRNQLAIDKQYDGKWLMDVTFPELRRKGTEVMNPYPEEAVAGYPLVMTVNRNMCGKEWKYFIMDYGNLKHLSFTFWMEPFPEDQFKLHNTKYVLPNLKEVGNKVQVVVPLFRHGAALDRVRLSPGLAPCVENWEQLRSSDGAFSLMNWVLDQERSLVPYRINWSKPVPE